MTTVFAGCALTALSLPQIIFVPAWAAGVTLYLIVPIPGSVNDKLLNIAATKTGLVFDRKTVQGSRISHDAADQLKRYWSWQQDSNNASLCDSLIM